MDIGTLSGWPASSFKIFGVTYWDNRMLKLKVHFGVVHPSNASAAATVGLATLVYTSVKHGLEARGAHQVVAGLHVDAWNVRIREGDVCRQKFLGFDIGCVQNGSNYTVSNSFSRSLSFCGGSTHRVRKPAKYDRDGDLGVG